MQQEAKLKVMEALQEEAYKGIVRLDAETMHKAGVRAGDIVEIEGGRKTVGIVDRAYPTDVGQAVIRMDGIIRRNAKTGIGEMVTVRKAEIKEAKKISIAPAQKGITIQAADTGIFRRGLLGRAVVKGDIVSLGGARRRRSTFTGSPYEDIFDVFEHGFIGNFGFGSLKFIITETNPKQAVIISEETEIEVNPRAVEVSEEKVPDVTYEDLGGLDEEIRKVREIVEIPLKYPYLFEKLGVEPPKGVLLHGPPGSGKTLLARAVANESDANFILLNGPEVVNKFYGESEKKVRDIFEQAEKKAPSIIFIDEIDAIAPKREEVHGEVERRIVSQLLTAMDGLKSRGKVIVIGATNRPNSLDPALRRPGRFDREIVIGVPNKKGRLDVLKVHTRNMPLAKSFRLEDIANITHGFVGADLSALCKEAAMNVLRKIFPTFNLKEKDSIPSGVLDNLQITEEDFKEALRIVRPSAMREVLIEKPNITWGDIGGMEELKQELKEAVEWPLKNPAAFKRIGIKPPKGILMYGPPGTGKTLLAKAVANQSEANFIQVKGPSLLNMWVGESLPFDEELIVKEGDSIKRLKIGDIVENRRNVEVIAFDQDKKTKFSRIADYIKHPLRTRLVEVTTKTGRKIKVSTCHSLFSFVNGKLASIPVSHLIPNESYIAVPKQIHLPQLSIKELNLAEHFKEDKSVFVSGAVDYIKKAVKIIGEKKACKILAVSRKYLSDILYRNLPVSLPECIKLLNNAGMQLDAGNILIKLKGSKYSMPAKLELTPGLCRLLGIWVAEGDFNGHTVRIHNQNKEIRSDITNIVRNLKMSCSEMHNCVTINSLLWQKIFKNVFGLLTGARNKRIPPLIFALSNKLKEQFLKGYYSGDGSIYRSNERSSAVEASTESKGLANDLMYMLLNFRIVASCYNKKEYNGNTTYRVLFMGVDNFKQFRSIGFIDKKRDGMVSNYIWQKKWTRTDLIPISGGLYNIASRLGSVYRKNTAIGKRMLKKILKAVDSRKEQYNDLWQLVDGDIYFDMVRTIKELPPEAAVYDVSINPKQNFVAGFGGIFAHNSEKGVREIFRKARQSAPTIIFFDEIDAIASRRGLDAGAKVTERMVNTLLAEMDGLEELTDVVVIAATNRPDVLDPALLRPGRFDRLILTKAPDKAARLEIFKIHTRNMKLAKDIKLEKLAEQTEDCVGADIEGICREAGMIALREDIEATEVRKKHFDVALKKIARSVPKEVMEIYQKIEEDYLRSAKSAIPKEVPSYMG